MPIGAFKLNSIGRYLAPASAPARTPITWTAVGNAQIDTAQSKFSGASALFDANGDYLSTGNNAVWSYDANQNFTWEMWWRSPTATAFNAAFFNNPGAMMLYVTNDGGNWKYAVWNGVGNNYVVSSALTISANTWYHAAFTRSGGDMKLWHNGTQVGTASGLSGAIPSSNGALIGMYSNTFYMNGWIDELRISKGIARYTGAFTPPTAPFTNDANTTCLLHMNGTDASTTFVDDVGIRSAKGISALGNAQQSTGQTKFGTASALFDGTGDYLKINAADFSVTGAVTIEGWFRVGSLAAYQTLITFGSETTNRWMIQAAGDTLYAELYADTSITHATTLTTNTWHHFAFTRSTGNVCALYLNGVKHASTVNRSGTLCPNGDVFIGSAAYIAEYLNGYMDEIRISNVERYTANFTPSTTAFTNDANTLLLIHANGANASTTFTDDNA